ncbi:dihydrofolate reductase family protein [Gloeothece verrucosa]|uniref:Bifunctional deaminase-reductase domain protein n=1 Tax=Gloeothece verrucosa (strain PCC 7822) TaxID=497965 RepID=E0UJM6_GLOV7|nr:dihydrofolate reductase family protein [Gloeothece verrucosa]ADN12270.1 bifunctional deaminase-reductase domain protein [Gloeothece verrucosa PCC 7822]
MKKGILFIATSLDGYIARKNGEIDWLFTDQDYGYEEFYQSIDITLIGYKTYQQLLTFEEFPYPDKINYVFSRHHKNQDHNLVTFISTDPVEFVKQLKQASGKNLWLVGGGQMNTLFLNANLLDEIIISIHPVILGEGIPLFAGNPQEKKLQLIKHQSFESGLIQITYKIKGDG